MIKYREKMPHFKPDKLKINLRLSINRLKLLEKKKSECRYTCNVSRCILSYSRNKKQPNRPSVHSLVKTKLLQGMSINI